MFHRLALHSSFILMISIAVAAPVAAQDNALETSVFRLELPRGWNKEGESTPVRARGPNSEVLLISVAVPAPGDSNASKMADTKPMTDFWKEGIRKALVAATSQQGMKTTEPFTETSMQGFPFFTAKSENEQRGSFLSCYGLIGRGGAVFMVTVEGWLKNKSTAEAAVEGMFKSIVWKRKT